MAIKRTVKSRGAPVRKSASTAPMRHVDVRPAAQLVAGDRYVGWSCKNRACGLLIAIAAVSLESKGEGAHFEDQLVAIKCPHCGEEDLYRWSARSEAAYAPRTGAG